MKGSKRNILNAAKENIDADFKFQIDVLQDKYNELINTCCAPDVIDAVAKQINEVTVEWDEWKQRSKKNKRKVGKRVKWTNTRDQHQHRTINQDALTELRKSRKENKKPHVGVEWLYEGALVTKRGKSDMMIVTRIAGEKVECLKDGSTQWFRGVALRPADWMNED